jgi:hypothetical protein
MGLIELLTATFLSTMSQSHSPPLRSPSPPSIRPINNPFTQEETTFLQTYLPAFRAYHNTLLQRAEGQRKVKNTKGSQKDWVLQNVFQPFLEKFHVSLTSRVNLDDQASSIFQENCL